MNSHTPILQNLTCLFVQTCKLDIIYIVVQFYTLLFCVDLLCLDFLAFISDFKDLNPRHRKTFVSSKALKSNKRLSPKYNSVSVLGDKCIHTFSVSHLDSFILHFRKIGKICEAKPMKWQKSEDVLRQIATNPCIAPRCFVWTYWYSTTACGM